MADAMLATLTNDRFSDPEWIFERKLDGVRCLAHRTPGGRVRLLSRNDLDMSRTYPELAEAVSAQAESAVVLDGEIVALEGRRTSFEKLQARIGRTDPDRARTSGVKVYYYVFDLLRLARRDNRKLPLLERKKLLRQSVTFDDPLRFTAHRVGAGELMYRQACERGDAMMVNPLNECASLELTIDRITAAMQSIGYRRHAITQLERWERKRTTGRFDPPKPSARSRR